MEYSDKKASSSSYSSLANAKRESISRATSSNGSIDEAGSGTPDKSKNI
jgi:hypothetical protein